MSLHGDDIRQEGKPHNAGSFQAVAFVTSTNIPVAKARHISKPNINGPKKYILPREEEASECLLCNNSSY